MHARSDVLAPFAHAHVWMQLHCTALQAPPCHLQQPQAYPPWRVHGLSIRVHGLSMPAHALACEAALRQRALYRGSAGSGRAGATSARCVGAALVGGLNSDAGCEGGGWLSDTPTSQG